MARPDVGRKRRLLLMAFRGAGKSTVVGLFCAWLLTIRPDLRLLTLSADEALARRMLRTARKAIELHPESKHVRPTRPEQWSAHRFSVAGAPHSRDPSMLAAGLDSNITGARADVIVCDDVEVPKTCATPRPARKAPGAPGRARIRPDARRVAALRRHAPCLGFDLRNGASRRTAEDDRRSRSAAPSWTVTSGSTCR